ncbi:efflux RND transporter permease subunit [uncultured Shewanella sp.]|uniref:efflux RND transporter permease subunit n=1 Tax=uncultured Shewanella sp. TaxID=173975 RepID=UPI00260E631D|nr:efflux RND transporter permease subunit [uncultured Shewanella sp.]
MLIQRFIEKPVYAITLCLLIILIGVAAYQQLPVRHFPLLPTSEVTITTTFPGASPTVMEEFVTVPMQRVLTGLQGLDYSMASNTEEQSLITLKFFIGTDVDAALSQIGNRINGIMWELPTGINSPVITKIDPNAGATSGILYIESTSKVLDNKQITEYLRNIVVPRLETVPGVYEINIFGGRQYAMRIWLLPEKMAAHKVTTDDITTALNNNNLVSTTGSLYGDLVKISVSTDTNLSNVSDFDNIVIRNENGRFVRIKDIGYSEFGATDYQSGGIVHGDSAVILGITAADKANSIETADNIIELLKVIQADAPEGLHIAPNWNVTQFSKQSIEEVYKTFFEAGFFVFIVIFIFLGSLRSITIPLVTIPLSMLGAASVMWIMGYSLNGLTLLAWVLAIGLVVDDSIVVLENIHRHMEQGMTRLQASIEGVKELRFAIFTITLSVATVFAPIAFVPGFSGAFFQEFALTMSFVVLVSGILALFVSPVMCTYLLPRKGHQTKLTKIADKLFRQVRIGYKKLLSSILHMEWMVAAVFILLVLGGIKLFEDIPSELMPIEDTGAINILGLGPSNANYEYLVKYTKPINDIYASIPERRTSGMINGIPLFGATNSISWILLKPQNERKRSEDEILQEVQEKAAAIPGIQAFAFKLNTVPGGTQQPLSFILKSADTYEQMSFHVDKLLADLSNYPGITNPSTTFRIDKPQLQVAIDRDKAADLGISVNDIESTLNTMLGKPVIGFFGLDGYDYEVIPQVPQSYRMNPVDLNHMYVRAANGDMISLENVISFSETVIPQSLDQFDQMRSATVTASIGNHYSLSQAIDYLENYVDTQLPQNYNYDFTGEARDLLRSGSQLATAFAFAIALIYLLLVVHFNNFLDPFIVMLSVPLAIVGALYAMYMTDTTLSIYTKIGLIMLVGLISKNGILIVDFANKLRQEGMNNRQAIINGASIRLRPILMTALSMICGALPLVISDGAGSVARNQIGWVIIGGMALGTCLSLFVVPTAYLIINTLLDKKETQPAETAETT